MRYRLLTYVKPSLVLMRKKFPTPALGRALPFLALCLFLNACELFNSDEDIPAYIHIDDIVLATLSSEGSSVDNITDAWVFVNGDLLGAWELPATIPILASGSNRIEVRAGVTTNGIDASRMQYPFFVRSTHEMTLVPGTIDTIVPLVQYEAGIQIFLEDFDDVGVLITTDANSDTALALTTVPDEVYEGTGTGVVHLDINHPAILMVTDENFLLPKNGDPAFIELDYKCNSEFAVGIIAYTPSQVTKELKIILKPTFLDDGTTMAWNKIYIQIEDKAQLYQDATDFEVYLEMGILEDDNGIPLVANPALFIDNLKVVYP